MSDIFRDLLKKIGSGPHTGADLTREEAKLATTLMLTEAVTPAQMGAFMMAHRIKRPTPVELAGMIDAYRELGTQLTPLPGQKVAVFGNPYDGRSRTVSVTPITALLLAASGMSVILHGGDIMPTKYGIPLIALWQGLGLDFSELSLAKIEDILAKTGLTLVYSPKLFPLTQNLIPYRDQIGKRPPIATLELMWSPYAGEAHIVSGFVHPPTEDRFQTAFKLLNIRYYTTIKGLEGSCDLPCSRTAIIGLGNGDQEDNFRRLTLNSRDYGFSAVDTPLASLEQALEQIKGVLQGKSVELKDAAIFNGGFYLWRFGQSETLEQGFEKAALVIEKGQLMDKLREIQTMDFCQMSVD